MAHTHQFHGSQILPTQCKGRFQASRTLGPTAALSKPCLPPLSTSPAPCRSCQDQWIWPRTPQFKKQTILSFRHRGGFFLTSQELLLAFTMLLQKKVPKQWHNRIVLTTHGLGFPLFLREQGILLPQSSSQVFLI